MSECEYDKACGMYVARSVYDDGRNDIKGEAHTLLDSALDVLWRLSQYIPEMWSDDVKDGYISLYVSADVLHEIERVLYVSEVD